MPWTPKISDGLTTNDGQWYSLQRRRNVPRRIKYNGRSFAYLSYITKGEFDILVSSSPKNSIVQLTQWDVYFYGIPTYFITATDDLVGQAPLYWKSSPDHQLARLIYLTENQIKILKSLDIHGSGVRTNNNYGPANIPSYQGDGGGGSGGGSGGGDGGGDGPDGDGYEDHAYTEGSLQKSVQSLEKEIEELTKGESKLFSGTLSSLGTMVSQSLNASDPKIVIENGSNIIKEGEKVSLRYFKEQGEKYGDVISGRVAPTSTGFLRQYWSDPTQATFGADTKIPAITGAIPNPFTLKDGTQVVNFTGSFLYFVDLQLQRTCGADHWDTDHFISVFRQVQAMLPTNNRLVKAMNNAKKSPENYGSETITGIMTLNLTKYKKSSTIKTLFNNCGKLAENISKGEYTNGVWVGFGTSNAVIKTLVDNYLADIIMPSGRILADEIELSGVDYSDIWNPVYTTRLDKILSNITNKETLKTIQEVLQTNVVNITSAIDFTMYEMFTGGQNDSEFATLREIGEDFGINYNGVTVKLGSEISTMIDGVEIPENESSVEAVSENGATVSLPIRSQLRESLIINENGEPATVLDVIGTACGYLTDYMKKINEGISEIYKHPKGIEIKNLLTEISRCSGRVPLTEEERELSESAIDYWETLLEEKKLEYKNLLDEVSQNADLKPWVDQVNQNYLDCCRRVYIEHRNWNKCKFIDIEPVDTTGRNAFVLDIPSLGEDRENIGTDLYLYGISQNNEAGDRLKASMGKGKTDAAAAKIGITRRNTI